MLLKQELSAPRRWGRKMLILCKSPAAASCAFGYCCRNCTAAGDRVSAKRADEAAAACPEHGPQRTLLAQRADIYSHQYNPSPLPVFPLVMLGTLRIAWAMWEQPGLKPFLPSEDVLDGQFCSLQWHEWDWKVSAGNLIQKALKCDTEISAGFPPCETQEKMLLFYKLSPTPS